MSKKQLQWFHLFLSSSVILVVGWYKSHWIMSGIKTCFRSGAAVWVMMWWSTGFLLCRFLHTDGVNLQIYVQWVERVKWVIFPLRQRVFVSVSFTVSLWSNPTSFWFEDRCAFVPWAFSHRTDLPPYRVHTCAGREWVNVPKPLSSSTFSC